MRRLSFVVVPVLSLVLAAACASSAQPRSQASDRTTTTTAAATTTSSMSTTAPPQPVATTTTSTTTPAGAPAVVASPTGVVVPVAATAAGALQVTTPCGHAASLSTYTPLGPVDVVLDPGHGGLERGAIGPNGLRESDLNLAVSERARTALATAGVKVAMTRTGDYMMTLAMRGQVVTDLKPKVFVSVHHNAEPDGPHDGPGTETYYQIGSADSKRLAGLIWEEVHNALSQYPIAWVGDTDAGAKYRPGSKGDYYAVLRLTHGIPAALGELSFITDPTEADLLARPDVQRVEGEAVARGIIRYLRSSDPGSGFTTPYARTEPAGGGGGQAGCVDPKLS